MRAEEIAAEVDRDPEASPNTSVSGLNQSREAHQSGQRFCPIHETPVPPPLGPVVQ
jgi:hypothetical protein